MKWRKGIADWRVGNTLYLSVPFTWLLDEAEAMAQRHRGPVVAGGPAVILCGAPWADTPPDCPYDTLAMHNPLATFTTRGCPNRCRFCVVPEIEGEFRELDNWKPAPMVCDNNLLAASRSHFERVIDSLRVFPACDLQGLEARLLKPWHLDGLATLRRPSLHFGFDHASAEGAVADAVARCLAAGLKTIGVYVLIGFDDTPAEAQYRLEKVREWGALPFPQRFQPLDARRKNEYLHPAWTEREMRRTVRYYSRLVHLGHIPFTDYDVVDGELFPAQRISSEDHTTPPA